MAEQIRGKKFVNVQQGVWVNTAITTPGIYSCRFAGEGDYCTFVLEAGAVDVLSNSWFTTNGSVSFKAEGGTLNVLYNDNAGSFEFVKISL